MIIMLLLFLRSSLITTRIKCRHYSNTVETGGNLKHYLSLRRCCLKSFNCIGIMAAFDPCCDEKTKEHQHYQALLAIPWRKNNTKREYNFNHNIGHINNTLLLVIKPQDTKILCLFKGLVQGYKPAFAQSRKI